jgi:putative transposase
LSLCGASFRLVYKKDCWPLCWKAEHWLEALNEDLNRQFINGIHNHPGLSLMSDNGCQPTEVSFMRDCSILGINNPKGDADTERMMRTMKDELVWFNDWYSPKEFFNKLEHGLNIITTNIYIHR